MYVPLTVEEFHRGYAVIIATATGRLQPPPMTDLPVDLDTGRPIELPDTPFNRAWIAACRTLAPDTAKSTSLGQRLLHLLPIARGSDYDRYRDDATGGLDVAVMAALARTPFSNRTTPKTMRAAFAAEFKRQRALGKGASTTPRH
jgi:hypothetical protein